MKTIQILAILLALIVGALMCYALSLGYSTDNDLPNKVRIPLTIVGTIVAVVFLIKNPQTKQKVKNS